MRREGRDHELVEHEYAQHDANRQRHPVVGRLRARPDQQRPATPPHEPEVFQDQPSVGDEEPDAEQDEDQRQDRLDSHEGN